jgi:hypothetical protein
MKNSVSVFTGDAARGSDTQISLYELHGFVTPVDREDDTPTESQRPPLIEAHSRTATYGKKITVGLSSKLSVSGRVLKRIQPETRARVVSNAEYWPDK